MFWAKYKVQTHWDLRCLLSFPSEIVLVNRHVWTCGIVTSLPSTLMDFGQISGENSNLGWDGSKGEGRGCGRRGERGAYTNFISLMILTYTASGI